MFLRTRLLETLTLYWATDKITTSLLPYWMYRQRNDAKLPVGSPRPAPTDRGGHFPAVAERQLLAGGLRKAFAPVRAGRNRD